MRGAAGLLVLALFTSDSGAELAPSSAAERVHVRVDAGEARAVLAILAKRASGQQVAEADWEALFASPGYVRLAKREASMKRDFDRASFRAFVNEDWLAARAERLSETLGRWSGADVEGAASRALAYLPASATIHATIYPVIKPMGNSFVFDVGVDPAIFLYLDPEVTAPQFENTLAHELHHIGYGTACPDTSAARAIERLPDGVQQALTWTGGFGEGFAMLAAAGGPDVHPHAVSREADRERWDRDLAKFPEDLRNVETFLADLASARLTDADRIREIGFSFFGVQGPWYTVGWKMAVTIERALGRDRLIAAFCDPRALLETYNEAARLQSSRSHEEPVLWHESLLKQLGSPE